MSECEHDWEWIQHLDVAWYECKHKHCDAVLNPERAEAILNGRTALKRENRIMSDLLVEIYDMIELRIPQHGALPTRARR